MNENLNLAEILKDCPSGTKLYSTVFGEVEFDHVVKSSTEYLIEIKLESFSGHKYLTAEGKLFAKYDGECTLFPSKEQRDWSKFKLKKEEFVTPYKFKDGDIVATRLGSQVFILKSEERSRMGYCYIGYDFEHNKLFHADMWYFSRFATEEEKKKLFDTIKLNGYKWNVETNTLEKLIEPKFKDGDIVATRLGSQVFILKSEERSRMGYCYIGYDFEHNKLFHADMWYFSRFATEEEKKKLFDTIKLNGYKWNVETNTLEKLIEPKFKVGDKIIDIHRKYMGASGTQCIISKITDDKYIFTDGSYAFISRQDGWELAPNKFNPKTLKPYDKVLVRDSYLCSWRCTFYSHTKEDGSPFRYITDNSVYEFCIPYNEETKHLAGTNEEAPEYYKYWED